MIVDIHVHAFPDALAERAIRKLDAETDLATAQLDGTLASLLASMDRAGIQQAVLCSIATRPAQFDPILEWSLEIADERIIPLPSVHPQDPDAVARIRRVAAAGLKGIKMHPYYQDFYLDDLGLDPLYAAMSDCGLMLVLHTGFDIAFPRIRRCDPERIAGVVDRFPDLRLVTTHCGAWADWDNVRRYLLGRPIYMETSFTLNTIPADEARDLITGHPAEYVLFGTDSPWVDQSQSVADIRALGLPAELEHAIFRDNALRLLAQCGNTHHDNTRR